MRKVIFLGIVVLCVVNMTHAQEKRARFILDFRPGSFLFSPDLDEFTVRNSGITFRETVSGGASYTPSINAGVGINFDLVDLNITAGPGLLINGAFYGGFWNLDVSTLFKVAKGHLRIGPHIGLIGLGEATWVGENEGALDPHIDLNGRTGFKGGLSLHAGGDRVAFIGNLDFVSVKYDIATSNGWVAQDGHGNRMSRLDMSGAMLDLGLILRF